MQDTERQTSKDAMAPVQVKMVVGSRSEKISMVCSRETRKDPDWKWE